MELFLEGILFFIGLQLVAVALLHFYHTSNHKAIPLAFICAIVGLWYFCYVFRQYWINNIGLAILIGPDKTLFLSAFLLFYFKSFHERLSKTYILKHLAIPFLVYSSSLIIRFYFPDAWPSFENKKIPFFFLSAIAIFWYYFFLTRKELKNNLKKFLLPKVYHRFTFLFYSFYFFLLIVPIYDMTKSLVDSRIPVYDLSSHNPLLYQLIFQHLENVIYIYIYLTSYFLFLYALTELSFIRQLLLPNNSSLSKSLVNKIDMISNLIDVNLIDQKMFLDPHLTVDSFAGKLGITKKEVLDYLKLTHKGSFIDYVNTLRIEEYKMLVKDEKYEQYDLVGLALECGFKSKSTFYRVFKQHEGITPNQFKKTN